MAKEPKASAKVPEAKGADDAAQEQEQELAELKAKCIGVTDPDLIVARKLKPVPRDPHRKGYYVEIAHAVAGRVPPGQDVRQLIRDLRESTGVKGSQAPEIFDEDTPTPAPAPAWSTRAAGEEGGGQSG